MTKHSFNLVNEKWIPCVMKDGTPAELGLLDTLVQAHEIREIFDPSPLVCAALHRLMLAVIHRVFGPSSTSQWQAVWSNRHFNRNALDSYFAAWNARFDLFEPNYPFYQVAQFGDAKTKTVPVSNLVFEAARGNNPTLFDHTQDQNCSPLPIAEATRSLLAIQCFKLSGLSGLGTNFVDAPSARSIQLWVQSDNLFETLLFNMVRYDPRADAPMPCSSDDKPAWETDKFETSSVPKGYLDYLTWQTLMLRLILDETVSNVTACEMSLGRGFGNAGILFDPLVAYRETDRGWVGLRFRETRALWRDSTSLFENRVEDGKAYRSPETLRWLGQLAGMRIIDNSFIYRIDALGMATDQAKINFWRHERFPLPLQYLTDEVLVHDLHLALKQAEDASSVLRDAVKYYAKNTLFPERTNPDWNQINSCADHLGVDQFYWSQLETPFYQCLRDLPKKNRNEVLDAWNTNLRRTCWDAFETATRDLDQSARTLRAIAKARRVLGYRLNEVIGEIKGKEEMHAGK